MPAPGTRAQLDQEFINALRAVQGKAPLYDDGSTDRLEAERFACFGAVGSLPARPQARAR